METAEKAAKKAAREAKAAQRLDKANGFITGVKVDAEARTVTYQRQTYPLPARASVETVGEVRRRVTATRVVAVGVFALALKKKKDDRELFLTVEGEGWSIVADVNPNSQMAARQVAARINSL